MIPKSWWAVLLVLLVVACGVPEDDDAVPAPIEESRAMVEANLSQLDGVMVDAAQRQAYREAIEEVVEQQAARPFQRRVDDGLRYSTVFQREYVEPGYIGVFIDNWGLTPEGERLLEVLEDSDRHALEVETLHLDQIYDGLEELVDTDWDGPQRERFSPTVDEVEALVELVAEAKESRNDTNGLDVLIDAVSTVDDTDDTPERLGRFRDYNLSEAQRFADRAELMAWLELYLADAALRYARKMRHKHIDRVDAARLAEKGSTEIILGRMQQTLGELRGAEDPEQIEEVMQRLEPSHPQYRALLEATDRYREFVADGGWDWVGTFQIEEGATTQRAVQLRDRLEAEGYDARPDDPPEDFDERVIDESLIDGIREYQETHQFVADGEPTPGFWRSLNIPAHDRLAQMELTLQRWRNSKLEDDQDFILVNIPLFEAEVWTDGHQRMSFEVVVGNNERRCDEDKRQWVYPDATPVLMSELDHIMLNPPWYVPDRIVEQTLQPRLDANEDYYEENNYEEVELADGREVVRQNPGPDNALGMAKFMFPNEHNVYMHDTPDPEFFDFGIRAFSHGCIRVSEPMGLAEFLLDWEGRDDVDVGEITAEAKEAVENDEVPRIRRIDFEREMPVFVEYYTVWIDDEGRPHFLADIYDKDAWRLADDPDQYFDCIPQVTADEQKEPEGDDGEDEHEPDDVDEDVGP